MPVLTRFDVEVTQADIDKAHRNDSYKCVVVQAIARILPEATRIEVDTQTIRFTLGERRLMYLTPPLAESYVIAFDYGDPIRPFRFRLHNPMEAKRRVRTEAGKARVSEQKRQKRATQTPQPARQEAVAREVKAEVEASEPARQEAVARDPETVQAVGRAAYAALTEPLSVTLPGTKKATRRVFKGKERHFGHRVLRINQ